MVLAVTCMNVTMLLTGKLIQPVATLQLQNINGTCTILTLLCLKQAGSRRYKFKVHFQRQQRI